MGSSARWAMNSPNNHVRACANFARCCSMSGGKRSRAEVSVANQRV